MNSISTKYVGPTDTRGSRIVAKIAYGLTSRTYTYPYQHELSSTANHARAARLTAERLGLSDTRWHCGETRDGCVFVAEVDEPAFTIARDDNR
jgi:hypothetical protein